VTLLGSGQKKGGKGGYVNVMVGNESGGRRRGPEGELMTECQLSGENREYCMY
jgi:hypothetical protein